MTDKMPDEIWAHPALDRRLGIQVDGSVKYIRADLSQACEAVGNEHCWTHDRKGSECQPAPEPGNAEVMEFNSTERGKQYMVYTDEQRAELEKLTRPIVKWLNDNYPPHNEININHHSVEILEGKMMILIPDYIKDLK